VLDLQHIIRETDIPMPVLQIMTRRCITTFISVNAHFRRHLHTCRTEGDSDSVRYIVGLQLNNSWRNCVVISFGTFSDTGFLFKTSINCIRYNEILVLVAIVKLHAVLFPLCRCSSKQSQSLLGIRSSGITGVDGRLAGQCGTVGGRCAYVRACMLCGGLCLV
jgi:hypothetical protein